MLRQNSAGFRQQIAAGTGGNVVENHRLRGSVRDGGKAFNQTLLGGFVVVGSHHQHGIRAGRAGKFGKINGVGAVVRAGAGDHRNAPCRLFDREGNGVPVCLVCEGGALAGGACYHNGGNAGGNLPIDQAAKSFIINAVSGQGGDNRSGGANKNRFLHRKFSFNLSFGNKKSSCN